MKKYLLKLHKINKNISDLSDYDAFLDSAHEYIKTHENEQEEIFNSLIKSLKISKSKILIGLIYKILSFFTKNKVFSTKISKKLIIKHFEIKKNRDPILGYVTSQDIHIIDIIIIRKLINNKTFVSQNLYKYVNNYPNCVYEFLKTEKPEFILKQISIIRNTNIDFNLNFYVKLIGSSSKIIAFNVSEAFLRFFKKKYKYDVLNGHIFFPEDSMIEIKEPLEVESPSNFIKYGFNFIKNRNLIIDKINSKKCEELAYYMHTVCKKGIVASEIEEICNEGLCYLSETKPIETHKVLETNFDYIFSKFRYKDICDCLEL